MNYSYFVNQDDPNNSLKMNTITRILFVSFLAAGFSSSIFAQKSTPPDHFISYGQKDGLSQNVVRSIAQGSLGYLWIGTEDGLNKFNGYDFTVFKKSVREKNSLADNFIYSLAPGKDGVMWVGTNSGGLARYNPDTENFKVFQHDPDDPTSINQGRIYSLHIGGDGNLWAGTLGGGLNRYLPEKEGFISYTRDTSRENTLTSNNIYAIAHDSRDNLWIRTEKDLNLYRPESQTFQSFQVPGEKLVFEQTNSMFMDDQDMLWLAYPGGIMKFNTRSRESTLIEEPEFKNNTITSICRHKKGQLWIGSYNGLYLFDKQDQRVVASYTPDASDPNSINDDMVVALFKDRTGSLWIAHGNTGMTKLNTRQKNFKHYKHREGENNSIPGNIIRALMVDRQNRIWVGTRNSGTFVLNRDQGNVRLFKPRPDDPKGMYNERTTCFFEDQNGDVYMGSWGAGIRVVSNGSSIPSESGPTYKGSGDNALRDSIIQAIYRDDDGTFWVGMEAGLDLYNPETEQYRHIRHDPDNANSIAPLGVQSNCIVQDDKGNFWIGTWGGLTMMRPKDPGKSTFQTDYQYQRFMSSRDDTNSLSDSRVISMHYNPENPGTLFVGTYGGGLNKIDINHENPAASQITTYTKSDGLSNNVIYGILEDEQGNLWMSTNKGLSRFNPTKETFTTFDANDGLQSSQFRWGAYARGSGNELLFGGPNGFNVFKADRIKRDSTLPRVVITDFKISNQNIVAGKKIDGKTVLDSNINRTRKITLDHTQNILSFEFAGLHYAYPDDNQYQYKLEGFNDKWITTDSDKRFATYTNLDPGTYTFRVKASNYDGVWNEQPASVSIRITPPFWQTTWFYVLAVLVVGSLITLLIRQRMISARKEKERLQHKVDEAVAEVKKQKDATEASNQELMQKQKEIQINNWLANSRAEFGDILRSDKADLHEFSYHIIKNLVKYSGAIAGALYLVNEEDEQEPFIEMKACYAYESRKQIEKKIMMGEGLVGRSIEGHEKIHQTQLPANYLNISSGLGQTQPDVLFIMPLVTGDEVYGAFELAALGRFEEHVKKFLEKVAEDIAITMKTTLINLRTNKLLEQSRTQYEELSSQKEELQQNIEELKATREEADRIKGEMERLVEALKKSSYFVQFDKDGRITDINEAWLQLVNQNQQDVKGRAFTDFYHSLGDGNDGYSEIWQAVIEGNAQKKLIKIENNQANHTLAGSFIPIPNSQGDTEKVVQIATDITPYIQ